MSCRKWPVALIVSVAVVAEARAQTPNTIFQAHLLGTSATADFLGVGVAVGRRAAGRLTYLLSATPGITGDRLFAVRSEGVFLFSLDPARRTGVSLYGGGGVAGVLTKSSRSGYLVIVVGVESAPQTRLGWFAELGVGGGIRGSLGWRMRR